METALVILDGWGLGDHDRRDAVKAADTPTFDAVTERGADGRLVVHGRRVGLPEGQMGNSEVGHLNIGAGRVVKQAYTRITDALEEGSLSDNDAVAAALDHADSTGGRVHFMGLVSDGGVHSDVEHLLALIDAAADAGVPATSHAFTDGRDTAPEIADEFLADVTAKADERGTGHVATVTGRYHAMDRDENWGRTKKAYDAIVGREAPNEAESAVAAAREAHARGETDEFVEPTLVADEPALADGDAVIFFNFRADRARQLVRMLTDTRPEWEFDLGQPEVRMTTMTEYDETFEFPVAFPPQIPANTIGEVVADAGGTQLRIAESEKYPHVTYFLNGGREVEFPGEIRTIVESPDVPTYDQQPEMSAPEVTDEAVETIASDDPDLLVLNYANPDMVGHTGDFEAAVEAVEAVDAQLDRLLSAVADAGAHAVVTADHGNADDMGTADDPHTAHTYNSVPFVYLTPDGDDGAKRVREGGSLCDIAPTLLDLMERDRPDEMTGESLLERKR
ncbi:2,3-bisphosphoglycerate-independent phosphoglycerate mutase [Halorubrum ezzemoulense]|uniref:2,3-bisphosphoglycerate-independent phosphoglycerate mutase n=1 Tax=Halorubrum ezzemoulense TaxID=337243 RepID=A0ABT4Z517_HALEZ|nr:2,3-bisphosphoglycerate-independent phosphoglycerate mutase [Halorubrum ezzemoulense]MDB2243563.1 2,3-bisphosphoglycerate-independent phosphoglycerate mutase [Halorubrum ezzemoulense]MDB2251629.1 2,3-bisphosphoglycerate-independent phosphoglycerate mutase [Halorubrum ezzemoulense]MDB2277299.1 2,3-bisphosphoglycerate-independent phosphoglycerate mutase [Halorubrum ezzemoulense]MDB2284009.1 2,3-bisphosphoglycerate-independent phosphoglycerate mutase [Halorubrum ezzemoulense]MDB2288926.1 2,3-b